MNHRAWQPFRPDASSTKSAYTIGGAVAGAGVGRGSAVSSARGSTTRQRRCVSPGEARA